MTPDQFFSLPVSIQMRRLIDAYPQVAAKAMAGECPKSVRPPKFDTRLRRKGGFIWASECDQETLRYYMGRARAGNDPKFADKNQRESKALDCFLQFRDWFPYERWNGERNNQQVTAEPPSSKPRVHEWEPRPGEAPRAAAAATTFDDDEYSGGDDSGENYF